MEKINKPVGLPDCKIINALILKSNSKVDYEFNYVNQLEEIRKLISIEVSRINLLFPEYTPHDEQYHLKRLFYVADQLLGDDLIDNMNATELFLLSVSLYGHDWGMALSEEEKQFILAESDCQKSKNINLLEDENKRIHEFCRLRNISIKDISTPDWQEYVRLTHAFRSGKRIKNYFEPLSSGIAEFASRICEGHWLDFDIIDDYTSYPTDASINREIVNIKALTIYVRLIDLLDLGEDRTPFILWKFVAPRNKFSRVEWAKHRSLQAVTFPRYQSTRLIQVDGSTDDQNVYMSIMDLKRYVDEQFRQCSDILNRINHDYHKLNISHIDWRIAARGFEPVIIQFEFDRNRMFDILADEIYQSNPFVFIRELLQNSIDAIAVRTEMLDKKDLSFVPKIDFLVEETDECYIVQISDNGIGMDEYIIRNYLAVASKSYYRSSDFQKESLKLDPISRFGIGVLSCFMCSDYIEVETFKDPNTTHVQDHIKLSIPAKENYFKIEKNRQILKIGTTFRVYVIKSKLPKEKKTGNTIDFDITEYLRKVAGFVKYPINIIENGVASTIHNPNTKKYFDSNEYKLGFDFPIEKAIVAHNINNAREFFEEKKIFLKEDLGLNDFDGCLTYLLPKSNTIDIINVGHSWPISEVSILDYNMDSSPENKIKWESNWTRFNRYTSNKKSIPERAYSVYMDGILIQDITPPEITIDEKKKSYSNSYYGNPMTESFINPQLIVNIPKPEGLRIDLARTSIESNEAWDKKIWIAFFKYLKDNLLDKISEENPKDRMLSISKLITFYKLSVDNVIDDLLPQSELPLPMIKGDGKLFFANFKCYENETINIAPLEFETEFYKLIRCDYIGNSAYDGILKLWRGTESYFNFRNGENFGTSPSSLLNMRELNKYFVVKNYFLSDILFVSSPLGNGFPLVSEIFKRKTDDNVKEEAKSIENYEVNFADAFSISHLNKIVRKRFYKFPTFIKFPSPFQSKMFYGFKYLNLESDLVRILIDICYSLVKADKTDELSEEAIGTIDDMIENLPFLKSYYSSSEEVSINDLNQKIKALLNASIKFGLIKQFDEKVISVTFNDFVENSIIIHKKTNKFIYRFEFNKYIKGKQEWGIPIT